jgi:hypothetical protein
VSGVSECVTDDALLLLTRSRRHQECMPLRCGGLARLGLVGRFGIWLWSIGEGGTGTGLMC